MQKKYDQFFVDHPIFNSSQKKAVTLRSKRLDCLHYTSVTLIARKCNGNELLLYEKTKKVTLQKCESGGRLTVGLRGYQVSLHSLMYLAWIQR